MRFIIFSGTTEGRTLSHRLAEDGASVTVSVATEYGQEEQGTAENIEVLCGRMTAEQMQNAIAKADLCIDATHPYAVEATANIREACGSAEVPYRRLLRPKSTEQDGVLYMANAESAVEWLSAQAGNILLATGAKELAKYAPLGGERLFPRVLPLHSSLTACEDAMIPHRNIIAMQGPFTAETNEALLRQYSIRFLVTKDGGKNGGFEEKLEAARRTGAAVIVLARPDENGYSYDEILRECREMMR